MEMIHKVYASFGFCRRVAWVLPLLFTLFSLLPAQAQDVADLITGRVLGNDSLPLVGAAVIIQRIDTTYLGGTVTDEQGLFRLKHPGTAYRLLFQHLSCKPLELTSEAHALGDIVLEEAVNELKNVVVTAQRPLLRMENGMLTYDLSAFAKKRIADNAFDLLKELPALSSIDGESLTLNGAMGATNIIINGKPSTMTLQRLNEYLKALPAERLEKAEITYNAPPQWHIRGAAINIVLKQVDHRMLQGQVQGRWTHRHDESYEGSGSFFFSDRRWQLDLLYSYRDNRSPSRSLLESKHTVQGEVYDIRMDYDSDNRQRRHDLYASLVRILTPKSNLTLTYDAQGVPTSKGHTSTTSNRFSDSRSVTDGDNTLHRLRLDYASPFGLRAGASYGRYKADSRQEMAYRSPDEADFHPAFSYDRSQQVDLGFFYADMYHLLKHQWGLYYGASYSLHRNRNTQSYADDQHQGADSYAQENRTDEDIICFYMNTSKVLLGGKLSFNFFLTGENYKVNDYEKWNLLPNLTVTYAPVQRHLFQFSYSTTKSYPSYWQRQNYVSYQNEYVVAYGNPDLRPTRTSAARLVYVLCNKYILQISYHKAKNFYISQTYQSDEELKMLQKVFNMDYTSSFSANAVIPFSVKELLYSKLTINAFNQHYKIGDWFGMAYDRNKWVGAFTLDNTLNLSKKPAISVNATVDYVTPTIQGIWDVDYDCRWRLNAGIKCSFARNRAILNFQCYDLLESATPLINVNYGLQRQRMDNNFYRRTFTLSFTYKFNDYKERRRSQVDTSRLGIQ